MSYAYDDPRQGRAVLDITVVQLIKEEAAWCKEQPGTMAVAADRRPRLLHEGQKLYLRAALISATTLQGHAGMRLHCRDADKQKAGIPSFFFNAAIHFIFI